MNREKDIAMADHYEREAEEDEREAGEAEKSIAGYGKDDQLCRGYIAAKLEAARFARRMAELHRDRAQQD